MKIPARWRLVRTLGALLCAVIGVTSSPAMSQAPPAVADRGPVNQTWADWQKEQVWATRKVDRSPRHHQWVKISEGGQSLQAWVDSPQTPGKVPVVIVLHEVFGITDSSRNTADEIAAMGYIVVAPDMLSGFGPGGGGTRSIATSQLTSRLLTGLDDAVVNTHLDAWARFGLSLPQANGKFAVVGLSWGGGAAFRYAATEPKDLKVVCVFYDVGPPSITQGPKRDAGLSTFSVGRISVPVFGFYGSNDTRVMHSLQATREAMAAAGKAYEPKVYDGADHAFMRVGEDPHNGNPANATAARASLVRLQGVLKDAFR